MATLQFFWRDKLENNSTPIIVFDLIVLQPASRGYISLVCLAVAKPGHPHVNVVLYLELTVWIGIIVELLACHSKFIEARIQSKERVIRSVGA